MLKHLQIQNLAVIEQLEINFATGMTVLTGETGAGKSILIDALGLILGARADTSFIRTGAEKTEVIAEFDLVDDSAAADLLREQSIEVDDEVMVRRIVNRDGRSKAYINTTSVPVQLLKELGSLLVDIYGQHAHQSLLKAEHQLAVLDSCGSYGKELQLVTDHYEQWQQIKQELEQLHTDEGEFNARLSLLEYQVDELENLEPGTDELDQLEGEYKTLSNMNQIQETALRCLAELGEGETSLNSRLSSILREIAELVQHDQRVDPIRQLLDEASIQLSEARQELDSYAGNLEQDPEQLQKVEDRINQLHDIARKHHIHPKQLFDHFQELAEKLAEMKANKDRVTELDADQARVLKDYNTAATQLHSKREAFAKIMGDEIAAILKTLGMPECRFEINITRKTDLIPHRKGISQIEFLVAANPGQELQPIRKAASGGELSRISLAIQVVAKQDNSVPTMIFDEVDAGIGGGTAEIVGNLLHTLGDQRQIFCVTHLAQVASQGDNHFQVSKASDGENTATSVTELDQKNRVEEIARMIGGVKISKQTRDHAEEMLKANSK